MDRKACVFSITQVVKGVPPMVYVSCVVFLLKRDQNFTVFKMIYPDISRFSKVGIKLELASLRG